MHALLVDDHVMFRQGMKFLLSDLQDGICFSEAGSCEEASRPTGGVDVDLVLLDMHLPGRGGLDALALMRERFARATIVVVSADEDPNLVRSAIEAGAAGFIPKSASSEVLISALRLILSGGVYLPRSVLFDGQRADAAAPSTPDLHGLTERQVEVLLRAIQGVANKTIAIDMGIAEGTVKAHLSSAYRVLGVHNRTAAVVAAARIGLRLPLSNTGA